MANKTSKYIKYAIGEILLVMIGILLALQVNNWNEERKTNNKSQVYINQIINDLVKDTLNINELIKKTKKDSINISSYFSFFNQGNTIDNLIDSAKNTGGRYYRYFPVNHTFLDMKASGNSNLLTTKQRNTLIQLESQQEQLVIIIEKLVSKSFAEAIERDKYLGYPEDFYQNIGKSANEDNKINWLIHQNLKFKTELDLYYFIKEQGEMIIKMARKSIEILTDEQSND